MSSIVKYSIFASLISEQSQKLLWLQPGHFFCYRLAASVGARIAAASGPGTKLLEKSRGQVSNLRRREQEKLRRQVSNLRWRLFGPPERPNNFPNPEQTSDPQTGRPVATPSFRVGGRERLKIRRASKRRSPKLPRGAGKSRRARKIQPPV